MLPQRPSGALPREPARAPAPETVDVTPPAEERPVPFDPRFLDCLDAALSKRAQDAGLQAHVVHRARSVSS
jgi:hypothetical protein